ncbi:MAG: type I 3-dehydroquinate dehydratase [Fuerstiella sp.]|nr:type I 3-dehydroquinate dehydratase [Fuerstiella sp.]MCP4855891.1 type I 3-dehydroquinate dehydratase [Fuerstiella sp.]
MICISLTPSSRTLAPADLLNASRKCDLIELCLDSFLKTPDIASLLKLCDKPVLVSCRRRKDGGNFTGTEDERMQLLRNTIVAEPEYVELDLDIAEKVPRFGKTKRVISYTSLNRPLGKIDDIFEQCYKAKADVVKFTWPTDDLDAAWPLLAAVTQARELPVVGQGIGESGLTFSLLGQKYGSPWIYAALERGMEAYEGQPNVWQLEEEYCLRDIDKKTRFIGVVGLGAAENTTVRVLNAAFQELNKPIRCLPLLPGNMEKLQKRLGIMKINAMLVDPLYSGDLSPMCTPNDELSQQSGYMDLALEGKKGWVGRTTLMEAVDQVTSSVKSDRWMEGRATTIFGCGPIALAAAHYLSGKNAAASIAAPLDNAAMSASKKADVRHIPWAAIHQTATDVIVLAGSDIKCGTGRGELNPSLIREKMVVIDLTAYPGESAFAEEARVRGATYVSPSGIFAQQLQLQFKMLTGLDLPSTAFKKGLEPA